jgi:integrase
MPNSRRRSEALWIEKRKRWQCNLQINGQRKTFTSKTPGPRGKIDAEQKADKWEPEKTDKAASVTTSSRFWEAYTLFLADNKARTSEGNHANNESLGKNWLKPRLEHRKLSTITEQDWQNCVNDAIIKGRSKKMLKNIRGAISAFNRFCKKNNVIMAPSSDIDIPKNAPVKQKAILQPDKLRILFRDETTFEDGKECPAFFIHAWRFCVLTGLRRGELLGLKPGDIKNGAIHIQRSINKFNHVGPTKTPKSNRTFRINKHMQRELEAQAAMLKSRRIISPWLFPDETGDHAIPATFYDRWCLYCEFHGFRVTMHDLRRTMISIGRTGLTEEQVKAMVGHTKGMDTFGVYGQIIDGEQQEVADALDLLFAKYLQEDQKDG